MAWLYVVNWFQNFVSLWSETVRYGYRAKNQKLTGCFRNKKSRPKIGILFLFLLFQITKIQNFETNSQLIPAILLHVDTVSDHKDTKFWNQFTTIIRHYSLKFVLFQITKIQNFETNSQHFNDNLFHNKTVSDHKDTKFWNQFTTAFALAFSTVNCFRSQRYKILKPIHNWCKVRLCHYQTVSDHKDTKFWNQFTTRLDWIITNSILFQITKIQIIQLKGKS